MVKEAEIDALYATPPAEFVAARNELVKRARAAKQDALARELAALRKPHAVVWLVNQLARRYPAQATALLEAGKELREAQHKALHGAGTAALRDANQAWRDAVSRAMIFQNFRTLFSARLRSGTTGSRPIFKWC